MVILDLKGVWNVRTFLRSGILLVLLAAAFSRSSAQTVLPFTITYTYDETISLEDRSAVEKFTRKALKEFLELGFKVPAQITVNSVPNTVFPLYTWGSAGCNDPYSGVGTISLQIGENGIKETSRHEAFHLAQCATVGVFQWSIRWLDEGSAFLAGNNNWADYPTPCNLPGTVYDLDDLGDDVYEVGWSATTYLLKKRGGIPALRKFYRKLGANGSGVAFELAFGWTYEAFKSKFAARLARCEVREVQPLQLPP